MYATLLGMLPLDGCVCALVLTVVSVLQLPYVLCCIVDSF